MSGCITICTIEENSTDALCRIIFGEHEFTFDYIGGGYARQSDDFLDGRHWDESYGWIYNNSEYVTELTDYNILCAIWEGNDPVQFGEETLHLTITYYND